ncbi:hypothetical protein CVD28_03430 [Bacillus sp. M6-12]|uniref:hypothetical protein n=1 Tax=Bacillus sp. M6-12 TaxID=2054166 RepID=UPI000C774C9A|nr:hypothetical protein [Bacillus sp. M6-12]PLS19481.1 hypothetical protein CVD28_03430 [Bacillus sp. M6-12]
MEYDLKIRQSYHGTGGKEGYKFKLYNNNGKKLGELKDVPSKCNVGNTVVINGELYIISHIYDSPNPRHERSEVMFYELKKYQYKPDFELGDVI